MVSHNNKQAPPQGGELSSLFTQEQPYVGLISMMFYIPDCDERDMLAQIIMKYGGQVTEIHECYTIQLAPIYQELAPSHFFRGDVFRATWITDSIKAETKLDLDEYKVASLLPSTEKGKRLKRIELMKMQPYVMTEALKIMEIVTQNKLNRISCTSSQFWVKEQEARNSIPGRTSESCRECLKVKFKNGTDYNTFFTEIIQKGSFSHYFKQIPRPTNKGPVEISNRLAAFIQTAPPKLINPQGPMAYSEGQQMLQRNNAIDHLMAGGAAQGGN